MTELLKIEWMKVRNYKAFWIFSLFYFVSIAGINYIGFYVNRITVENVPMGEALLGSPFGFPKIWNTVGFMSSWVLYFPGILFIMLFTNEFNFKTHRQNIIDGWERKQFISVKFVFAFLFSLVATLFNVIVAVILGLATSAKNFSFSGTENILYIFIQTFSYISFAMFLAILFRRSGVAIAIFFLYGLIFEWILTTLINFKFNLEPWGYFLPLQVTDTMLPLPFGKKILYKGAPEMWVLVIISLIYLVAYYLFSLRKFTRDDL
ncbi:MAG: ABC transporter permease [Chitinophagaceae bacterium]|nr:ABC transporter permease [Chitinophagaceae bacterium]